MEQQNERPVEQGLCTGSVVPGGFCMVTIRTQLLSVPPLCGVVLTIWAKIEGVHSDV